MTRDWPDPLTEIKKLKSIWKYLQVSHGGKGAMENGLFVNVPVQHMICPQDTDNNAHCAVLLSEFTARSTLIMSH